MDCICSFLPPITWSVSPGLPSDLALLPDCQLPYCIQPSYLVPWSCFQPCILPCVFEPCLLPDLASAFTCPLWITSSCFWTLFVPFEQWFAVDAFLFMPILLVVLIVLVFGLDFGFGCYFVSLCLAAFPSCSLLLLCLFLHNPLIKLFYSLQ